MISLLEVVEYAPQMFYGQPWWPGQAFAKQPHGGILTMPGHVIQDSLGSFPPEDAGFLPWASALALLYVAHPNSAGWGHFMWCADKDDHGNRVYVGGVGFSGIDSFQVHRALDYQKLCGVAVWAR